MNRILVVEDSANERVGLLAQSLADELVYNEVHNEVVLLKYLKGIER